MSDNGDSEPVIVPSSSRKRNNTLHDSSSEEEDYLNTSVKRKSKHSRLSSDSESSSHYSEKKRKPKTRTSNHSAQKFVNVSKEELCVEYLSDEDFIVKDGDDGSEHNLNKKTSSKTLHSVEEADEKKKKRKYEKKLKELLNKKNNKNTKTRNKIESSCDSEESVSEESIAGTDSFIDDNEEGEECFSDSQDIHDESENEDSSNSSESYRPNPHLERDEECDEVDVMKMLSRSTEGDTVNKEKYMEQQGKYQLQIRSQTNPAIFTSEAKRYQRYMRDTNNDLTFKEMRGLNPNDDEYYDWIEKNVCGQKIKIRQFVKPFMSIYDNHCSIRNCNERIVAGQSLIIPCMFYDPEEKTFVKRLRQDGNRSWFYICHHHHSDLLDVDESLSGISDWSVCDQTHSSLTEDSTSEEDDDELSTPPHNSKQMNNDDEESTPPHNSKQMNNDDDLSTPPDNSKQMNNDDDLSTPPHNSKQMNNDDDLSTPPHNSKQINNDDDLSTPPHNSKQINNEDQPSDEVSNHQ